MKKAIDDKLEYMNNNTVSKCETRFLKGVEIVEVLMKRYDISNENWTYPYMTFGNPGDPYYAEIWENGMDWNKTFYLLEQVNYSIDAYLLMMIDGDDWIKLQDTKEFFNCIFWMRRDREWIKSNDYGIYHDNVLPFLVFDEQLKGRYNDLMYNATFEHASQPKIEFLINQNLIFNERREKLLNIEKSIEEVEKLSGVKIETQYGNRVGKIVHSPNDPWTCDDCGNSVYNCKC